MSSQLSEEAVRRAASELLSQERYNPAWWHPGEQSLSRTSRDYEHRARLILEAALTPDSSQCRCSTVFRQPKGNGTCGACGGWLPGERSAPVTRMWGGE